MAVYHTKYVANRQARHEQEHAPVPLLLAVPGVEPADHRGSGNGSGNGSNNGSDNGSDNGSYNNGSDHGSDHGSDSERGLPPSRTDGAGV